MKNLLRLFMIIALIIIFKNSFSQTPSPSGCGTDSITNTSGDPSRGVNCSSSGTDYTNKYRKPTYWVPDNNTPIKTILVNIIVCRDDLGNNGWQDTPQWRSDLDILYSRINGIYSNVQTKGYALTCEPSISNIIDTRIRFEINEVMFFNNSAWNSLCCTDAGTDAIDNYVRANYPNSRKAINHIFTASYCPPGPYANAMGAYRTNGNYSYVVTNAMWDGTYYMTHWDYTAHFAHEYGHALGLSHTYDTEIRLISHYDFLDDNFGTCAEPSGPCVGPSSSGNVGYLKQCFFSGPSGNPLMCGKTLSSGSTIASNTYISPKSAGRMHRALSMFNSNFGINDKPMHQYVKEQYSYYIPKEITTNETWDFAIQLYQDLTIKTGSTLTITCEVRMPKNGKIIVEPGAKLVLNGGVITCGWDDGMWQGIEVWGDRTKDQAFTNQGYLVMQNGAIIEKAHLGVTLSKGDEGYLYNGGVIQATNSTFKNNRRSVEFKPYHSPTGSADINLSYFNNCTFICDGPLQDVTTYTDPFGRQLGSSDFVYLFDVTRVNFRGNTFINTGTFDADIRGRGINGQDASFNVTSLVTGTTTDKNEFIDLTEGIRAFTKVSSAVKNAIILNCIFTNVYHGITGNIQFSNINTNIFNYIPTGTGGSGPFGVDAWGIYMNGAKGFSISNSNVFNTTGTNNYGVIVKNSAGFGGTVSQNTFNNLAVATQTELNNPSLGISCNNYNTNQVAWAINPLSTSSTFANQGTGCSFSQIRAGNQFSNNTCDIQSYLTANWQYYGWGDPASTIPSCVVGNVSSFGCLGTGPDPSSCVSFPLCTLLPCAISMEASMLSQTNQSMRSRMLSQLIAYYSSNGNESKVVDLLINENTLESRKILIPTYIDQGNYTGAQNFLDQIPNNNSENINYKTYYQVLIDLGIAYQTVDQITAVQEQIIRNVAASTSEVSVNAQAILEFVKGEAIINIPEKEITSRMAAATNIVLLPEKEEQPFLSDNYPNPYTDFTSITAKIPLKASESSIEIYSIVGEKMKTYKLVAGENYINVKKTDLGKGIFFYSLIIDGKKVSTKQMLTID
jgi:hypothetical protein